MPVALTRLVEQLLESKDFYPDQTPDQRRVFANSIADQLKSENHLSAETEPEFEGLTFEFEQVNATPIPITVEASSDKGDLLRFRNAILAQAETNKNNDDISVTNVDELAATLAGRAVDIGHDELANAGIITAARKVLFAGNPAVAIDGIGWRDRYPAEWDGVRAGTHHLSVEADADKAVCSICKGEFSTSSDYCEHLRNRRLTGAKRGFIGLKGKGAGITTKPAGTGTRFDRDQIFVVAHQEPENQEEPPIAKPKTDPPANLNATEPTEDLKMDKCPRCNAEVTAELIVCPACHKDMQASVIAAELKASETSLEQKNKELAEALASLESLEPLQKKVDEATSGKEKVEADLKASGEELAQANTKLETAQADLTTAQNQLAQIKAAQREAEIKPLLTAEAWEERKPAFLAMDDSMFSTMAASLKEVAKKPAGALIGIKSGMPEPVAGSDNGKKIALR